MNECEPLNLKSLCFTLWLYCVELYKVLFYFHFKELLNIHLQIQILTSYLLFSAFFCPMHQIVVFIQEVYKKNRFLCSSAMWWVKIVNSRHYVNHTSYIINYRNNWCNTFMRDADKSLAWPASRCCRAELIVSLERGVCSCAELQVFSYYRGWKEACQVMHAISTTWRRKL